MKLITSRLLVLFLGVSLAACNSAMQTAEKHYDNGEYELAIKSFKKAATQDPAKANLLIAESYRRSNRLPQSAEYYQKALEAGSEEPTLRLYYGYALKAQGKYAAAADQLAQFSRLSLTNRSLLTLARRELENLTLIDSLSRKVSNYLITDISGVNTETSEFAPVLHNDQLIFTAARKDLVYKANGQPMLGLYEAKLVSPTETGKPELLSEAIFGENMNEGTPAFSKDGKMMIFARGNTGRSKGKGNTSADVDLYISRKTETGGWGEPQRLAFSDSASWDGSPAFSVDGGTLYFASNRAGGSGGLDLWRVNIDKAGRFGRPANMGRDLNTPGNELFPYVSPDAKLYFASDGHPGFGGLDLFEATRNEGIIAVQNLGLPFNSTADDFGLVWADSTRGYFASNREGGKGDDDIYYFTSSSQPVQIVNVIPPAEPIMPSKPGRTVRYFLAGTVIDSKTQQPLEGVKVTVLDDNETSVGEATTGANGKFGVYPIRIGRDYNIVVERPEYIKKQELFITEGKQIPEKRLTKMVTDTTLYATVDMLRKEVGAELTKTFGIEPIYYDFDKYNIRVDASTELDKVVRIMQDNPDIKIELGSHTDSRGTNAYNERLSQRRAESAVNYIISRGISPERITAKGYGESELIIPNAQTEEEHQLNRRTEFKIVGLQ
ncbi:MAG: OmpA family protein [Siphonobacter sp.]